MEQEMSIYYDEEGDFLEIATGSIENCYFHNTGRGIFEIIDKTTKEIKGIAIFNFKKRAKTLEAMKLSLPFKFSIVR